MINLVLNEQQAQVLVNLLNIALKAEGINAAEAVLYFTKQIQQKLVEPEKISEPTETQDVEVV